MLGFLFYCTIGVCLFQWVKVLKKPETIRFFATSDSTSQHMKTHTFTDCKSDVNDFGGSNPPAPTIIEIPSSPYGIFILVQEQVGFERVLSADNTKLAPWCARSRITPAPTKYARLTPRNEQWTLNNVEMNSKCRETVRTFVLFTVHWVTKSRVSLFNVHWTP